MSGAHAWLASTWTALLMLGILTAWVRDRWAIGAFQIGFFVLGAIWLTRLAMKPAWLQLPRFLLIPAGVVVIGTAQMLFGWTVHREETLLSIGNWATHLVAMALAAQFATVGRIRMKVREALFWFAAVVTVVALIQNLTSGGKVFWLFESGYQELVMGPFVYRNKFAQFLELLLPLAVFRAVERPRWAVLSLGVAAVMVAGPVAAGSRSGFLVAMLEAGVMLTVLVRGDWLDQSRFLKIAAQVALLVVLAGGVVGWEFLQSRFKQDMREDVRFPIAAATVDMYRQRPVTGFGLGAWPQAYPEFARLDTGLFVNQAHCDWLQWAAEGGTLMLVLMMVLALMAARSGISQPWSLGVIFVLLHGLADYPMQQVPQFATLVLSVFALAATNQPEHGNDRARIRR